jgi:hypothetical protein
MRFWIFRKLLVLSIRILRLAWLAQRGDGEITISYGAPDDGKPPCYRVDDGPWIEVPRP